MSLKPQDTLLSLKYWSIEKNNIRLTTRALADVVGISSGEVSKSTQRLIHAGLIVERNKRVFVLTDSLIEWLCYGVRYAYPYQQVGYGRGMPTSWNCALIHSEMVPPIPALVWERQGGMTEGAFVKPIHQAAPLAASTDDSLYQALSLIDAIRGGKPRELSIARKLLIDLIKGVA